MCIIAQVSIPAFSACHAGDGRFRIVEAVGEGVTEVKAGDRVAYAAFAAGRLCAGSAHSGPPPGQASGEHPFRQAAGMMLRG